MQDMVGGDNNRTPVIFRDPDNCNMVGDINGQVISRWLWLVGQTSLAEGIESAFQMSRVFISIGANFTDIL